MNIGKFEVKADHLFVYPTYAERDWDIEVNLEIFIIELADISRHRKIFLDAQKNRDLDAEEPLTIKQVEMNIKEFELNVDKGIQSLQAESIGSTDRYQMFLVMVNNKLMKIKIQAPMLARARAENEERFSRIKSERENRFYNFVEDFTDFMLHEDGSQVRDVKVVQQYVQFSNVEVLRLPLDVQKNLKTIFVENGATFTHFQVIASQDDTKGIMLVEKRGSVYFLDPKSLFITHEPLRGFRNCQITVAVAVAPSADITNFKVLILT